MPILGCAGICCQWERVVRERKESLGDDYEDNYHIWCCYAGQNQIIISDSTKLSTTDQDSFFSLKIWTLGLEYCCLWVACGFDLRRKTCKYQGWEPMHQKYKANENTSRHKPKKKQKQTINKNQVKTHAKRAQEAACMLWTSSLLLGPKKLQPHV
jgi:hypothetical protein